MAFPEIVQEKTEENEISSTFENSAKSKYDRSIIEGSLGKAVLETRRADDVGESVRRFAGIG